MEIVPTALRPAVNRAGVARLQIPFVTGAQEHVSDAGHAIVAFLSFRGIEVTPRTIRKFTPRQNGRSIYVITRPFIDAAPVTQIRPSHSGLFRPKKRTKVNCQSLAKDNNFCCPR